MDIRVDARYYVSTINPINRTTKPAFRGKLEETFFKEAREASPKAYRWLTREFDVLLTDKMTGNNFLHYVCKGKDKNLYKAGYDLIKSFFDQKEYEKLNKIFELKNKEGKQPIDYLSKQITSLVADTYYRLFLNMADDSRKNIGKAPLEAATAAGMGVIIGTASAKSEEKKDEKVGNEVTEKIDLSGFDFDDEDTEVDETSSVQQTMTQKVSEKKSIAKPSGINAIVGQENIKKIFEKEIIKPLKNNKNVFINGFLIHGPSGTGKTFAIEQLAEELEREIIPAAYFLSKFEKVKASDVSGEENNSEEQINKILDSSIIKINPDNVREVLSVSQILKEHYQKTNKQGIVFIDEIQKFFPEDSSSINNTSIIQALEKSARNGMIFLSTTRDIDSIDQTILNSLRFEKMIELKFPRQYEIVELLDRIVTSNLANSEIEILAKKLNGFSFNDITRIIEQTQYHIESPVLRDYEEQIKTYAKEHSIVGLGEEGTTGAYDTFLKRVNLSDGGPKSLDDVMGMKEVKSKLKKVFGPVKKSSFLDAFFKENKIKKPNGILLYGPPGCGKTFIMNAVAADTGLPMYQMKFSDISSSFINETERNIKKVFDQLRKKYKETGEASILFFDECDSFFAKDSNERNTKVLNTLKEEMNNAGEDGIYVVAATNEKDNLNTAIVRDGRFDTKIEVGYPDEEARIALIRKSVDCPALKNLQKEDIIKELAQLTKGLSNASIAGIFSTMKYEKASIVSEKANTREEFNELLAKSPIELEEVQKTIAAKKEEINKMKLKTVDRTGLEWQAKTAAYDEFKERVYYTKEDPKSLNDVVGMEKVKKQMILKVLAPLNPISKKIYEEENLAMGGGIILHGPGGVGKTFIVRATAAESKIPLYEMKISEEGSSYVNQTSRNIQNIFNQLKRKYRETGEPSILFLDECDSLLGVPRDSSGASSERMSVINTLKQELATAQANGIMVIAATNNYRDLDPVVIRSGRFNDHIKVDYPDEKARSAYLKHVLGKRPSTKGLCENEENFKALVELTKGMSNADIKASVENSVISSQEKYIKASLDLVKNGKTEEIKNLQREKVSFEKLKEALTTKLGELKEQRRDYED